MPYKRRTSKERDAQITPAAIELFAKGRRLIRRGDHDAPELSDISYQLAAKLKLRPWMTCPLDTIG